MRNTRHAMILKLAVYKLKGNNSGRGRGESLREREMGIAAGWDPNFTTVTLVGLHPKYSDENGVAH